jgi:SAM-dependent methyltransferase
VSPGTAPATMLAANPTGAADVADTGRAVNATGATGAANVVGSRRAAGAPGLAGAADAAGAAGAAGAADAARPANGGSPFAAAAADYDRCFTDTSLGGCLRRAVWRRLDAHFAPGDRVLELGCGTGEDALHLAHRGVRVVATDAAAAMVETTRRKLAADGAAAVYAGGSGNGHSGNARSGNGGPGNAGGCEVRLLAIEDLGAEPASPPFDGAFANFGGLNCVADLAAVARALAARLRPGAPVLLCVMGPLAPWEWLWLLRRGQPREVFRRLRHGGVRWRGLTVRYPSIGTLRRAFAADFRLLRVSAVGALLPTTSFAPWAARHPRLLAALDRLERRVERLPPLPWLADHYLAELVRKSPPAAAAAAAPGGGSSTASSR